MSDTMMVFDRRAVRACRDRAAAGYGAFGFLKQEIAERLAERLDGINRQFPLVVDLGCHLGAMGVALGARNGIEQVIQTDLSPAMARAATRNGHPALAADEEALPFAPGSLDLVTSCLSLHWVNDLPGALMQIRQALRPDGLFLGAMLGGTTLVELREVMTQAEIDIEGGLSPRLSPFADLRDAGGLLQRAGFALPVVDSDWLTVTYENAFALMRDLRGMGETNSHLERRRHFTRRATLLRAAELYQERFAGPDGRITATFQILYLTAWTPHAAQQQPKRRGSATARLADALGAIEVKPE
ncbi:MAG: methyltransferase domain-containing protein [Alphaproteobacteria bacterium]|nr:methyltransferase domain-containing protein [Alphaproteobacteria bacterium]MBU0796159.1 methyltransferase domain-containing protein [Alphaproteobacteria bacterium]MBU0888034.1 methyltransferase domain-containing protein [Alphaproteobacteria bacterium]MBU1813007.1 methyltransferase domain-containing protein [Alphaproteobacteria bacterium]